MSLVYFVFMRTPGDATVLGGKTENDSRSATAYACALIPLAFLLPYLDKPYYIDDSVYLEIAKQILLTPWDFFGFEMNWGGKLEYLYEFNRNPPGISYFIALVGGLFGFGEVTLHTAFLIPTFFTGVGIYRVAERFTPYPAIATICATITPGFLVSTSNLMCEPFVAVFYIWAIEWWLRGTERSSTRCLVTSAMLIGVGALCKYICVTAIPLLIAYSLLKDRKRLTTNLAYFLIPVMMLAAYELYGRALYDTSLLFDTVSFSTERASGTVFKSLLANVAFVGGCFITPVFLYYLTAERFPWRSTAITVSIITAILLVDHFDGGDKSYIDMGWSFTFQLVFALTSGILVLRMAVGTYHREKTAEYALLSLLVLGTFVFAGFVNWAINARALLPMAPAVAIILLQNSRATVTGVNGLKVAAALGLGAAVSIAILLGDYRQAEHDKKAAIRIEKMTAEYGGKRAFHGEWGFRAYLIERGFEQIDVDIIAEELKMAGQGYTLAELLGAATPRDMGLVGGDIFAVGGLRPRVAFEDNGFELVKILDQDRQVWISTMNRDAGAGFYYASFGTLPYVFGPAQLEDYRVYRVSEEYTSVSEDSITLQSSTATAPM